MTLANYDAFISYEPERSADAKAGELIHAALQRAGLTAWTFKTGQLPGRDEFGTVVHGLRRSRCVVAVVSARSLKSKWRNGELFTGHSYDAVVPILLGVPKDKLPFGLSAKSPIIYREQDVGKVVAAVRDFKSAPPKQVRDRAPGLQTSEFLGLIVQWPPPDVEGSLDGRERIAEALRLLRQRPALLQPCTDYESLTRIVGALDDIEQYLTSHPDKHAWRALGVLAQPFQASMSAHAYTQAELPSAEFANAIGETREQAVKNVVVAEEVYVEAIAAVIQHKAVLDSIAPPEPPAPPPLPSRPVPTPTLPAPSPPEPEPTPEPEAVEPPPEIEEEDQVGERRRMMVLWLSIVVGVLLIVGLAGTYVWEWLAKPSGDLSQGSAGSTSPPAEPSSPPPPSPPPPPKPKLSYCETETRCHFPKGYSFARVAQECYADQRWTPIWDVNKTTKQFRGRDPHDVFDGEQFDLPRACDPKAQYRTF